MSSLHFFSSFWQPNPQITQKKTSQETSLLNRTLSAFSSVRKSHPIPPGASSETKALAIRNPSKITLMPAHTASGSKPLVVRPKTAQAQAPISHISLRTKHPYLIGAIAGLSIIAIGAGACAYKYFTQKTFEPPTTPPPQSSAIKTVSTALAIIGGSCWLLPHFPRITAARDQSVRRPNEQPIIAPPPFPQDGFQIGSGAANLLLAPGFSDLQALPPYVPPPVDAAPDPWQLVINSRDVPLANPHLTLDELADWAAVEKK